VRNETATMNCFRHPNEVAAVYCKGCNKPLCLACCEQTIGGQTHVCSEACARIAGKQAPDPEDAPDGLFNRIFAKVYFAILVVVLGGAAGGFWFTLGGTSVIDRIGHQPRLNGYSRSIFVHQDPRASVFRILYDLGITDWRALFGIGAVLGIGCAVLYLKRGGKLTVLICAIIYIVLKAWVSWTSM
jgi:hypothetical protein